MHEGKLPSRREGKEEYDLELTPWDELPVADALVLAVPHKVYRELSIEQVSQLMRANGIVIDVKSCLDRSELTEAGLTYWRL